MSSYTVTVNGASVCEVRARNCYDACVRAIKETPRHQRQKGDRFTARSSRGGRVYSIVLSY